MKDSHQQTAEALHHAQVEIARLRGEIEAMRQSPSWRITKPLRAFKRGLKKPVRGRT
jgi:hypothetical protein